MTTAYNAEPVAPQPSDCRPELPGGSYPSLELVKGDKLYHLGDEAVAVYQVQEGLLKQSFSLLSGRERIIAIAGPGDMIGAVSATASSFRDSAEALSPRVRVGVINNRLSELDETFKLRLYEAASVQLARLQNSLEDGGLPVNARLARSFLRLGERFGGTAKDGYIHLTLPLTHENLASMVGAARETTTALMGEMREQGVLLGTRGRYRFDPVALRSYVHEAVL